MGQRSQIYVAFNNGERDKDGVIIKTGEQQLVALYFQWNYGSRMISRAAGLGGWLKCSLPYLNYQTEKIKHIAETNFDLRDVVFSHNIINEAIEFCEQVTDRNRFIFEEQDNNDGKLFISIGNDGKIKYCLTDCDCTEPMTASQYMEWGGYWTEEEFGSDLSNNLQWIEENMELMTADELTDFINAKYSNVYH